MKYKIEKKFHVFKRDDSLVLRMAYVEFDEKGYDSEEEAHEAILDYDSEYKYHRFYVIASATKVEDK